METRTITLLAIVVLFINAHILHGKNKIIFKVLKYQDKSYVINIIPEKPNKILFNIPTTSNGHIEKLRAMLFPDKVHFTFNSSRLNFNKQTEAYKESYNYAIEALDDDALKIIAQRQPVSFRVTRLLLRQRTYDDTRTWLTNQFITFNEELKKNLIRDITPSEVSSSATTASASLLDTSVLGTKFDLDNPGTVRQDLQVVYGLVKNFAAIFDITMPSIALSSFTQRHRGKLIIGGLALTTILAAGLLSKYRSTPSTLTAGVAQNSQLSASNVPVGFLQGIKTAGATAVTDSVTRQLHAGLGELVKNQPRGFLSDITDAFVRAAIRYGAVKSPGIPPSIPFSAVPATYGPSSSPW